MKKEMVLWGMSTIVLIITISPGVKAFQPVYKCVNESHLGVTLDIEIGSQTFPIEQNSIYCEYGCNDHTWISFGNPSCRENPIQLVLVGVIIVILFILLMRFLL